MSEPGFGEEAVEMPAAVAGRSAAPAAIEAAKPILPYESVTTAPDGTKLWRVGTLTYTTTALAVLFGWLLWGDFGWSMKERLVWPVLPMLLKRFGANDRFTSGLMVAIPAAIGILLGPVISYKSDRHRGRWGRRIPYLMITTPIAVVGMLGLAAGPRGGSWLHDVLFGHAAATASGASEDARVGLTVLLMLATFWTLFEFATVAANLLFSGLINDVVPVPVLGQFYGFFRALSLIAGMIFNRWLIGKAEQHYVLLFVSIALLYGVGFTMMCLKVKEGEYPPPPPAPPSGGKPLRAFWSAAVVYLRECFTMPYYLWVCIFWTLAQFAFIPVNTFTIYFAKSLNISMATYGNYVFWSYTISLILAWPLGYLADWFHPLRVGMVTMALYAAVTLWGGLYAETPRTFAIALVLHVVLSGCFFTTTGSLQLRLFPKSRFAQFASAAGVLTAVWNVSGGLVVGWILDESGHVYRYTFALSCAVAVISLISGAMVYRGFVALGGPNHYVAPLPHGDEPG